jgi:hypothetical protein
MDNVGWEMLSFLLVFSSKGEPSVDLIFGRSAMDLQAISLLNKKSYPNGELQVCLTDYLYFARTIAFCSASIMVSEAKDSDLRLAKSVNFTFFILPAISVL